MTMKSFIMFCFILQSVQAVRLKTVNNEDFTTTWGGATCTGTCSAVTCSIDNSNQQAGSASACGDGYAATMESTQAPTEAPTGTPTAGAGKHRLGLGDDGGERFWVAG